MRKEGKDLHILEKSSNFAAWKVLWRIYNLQFTIYNLQCTKGFWSLVQRFKVRTFYCVCTKATRTLC